MLRLFRVSLIALLAAAFVLPLTVSAHGHTEVGDYKIEIGFRNEPAYQGEPNGLDLAVTNTKTNQPVTGLEDTLKVEISHGTSTRALELRPQFGEEGAYTADVLPTEDGDYTWHITGMIESTPVDISMMSGPETFGAVRAKSSVAFPAPEATAAELQSQVAAAAQAAQTALYVGIAGAVLGLIGLVAGILGLRARAAAQPDAPSQRAA